MIISALGLLLRAIKYGFMAFGGFIALLMLSNCTMLGLNYASLETANKPAAYPAITPTTLVDWQAERGALQKQFEDVMYGPWPAGVPVELVSRETVHDNYLNGRGTLEKLIIKIGAGEDAREFMVGLATPNDVGAPLIICLLYTSPSPRDS